MITFTSCTFFLQPIFRSLRSETSNKNNLKLSPKVDRTHLAIVGLAFYAHRHSKQDVKEDYSGSALEHGEEVWRSWGAGKSKIKFTFSYLFLFLSLCCSFNSTSNIIL